MFIHTHIRVSFFGGGTDYHEWYRVHGGAVLAATVGVLCFTYAGATLLQRHLDPAEAWGIVGGLYAVAGLGLYLAATRRRRGWS